MSFKMSDITAKELSVIYRALNCFVSEAGSMDREDVEHAERLLAAMEDVVDTVHLEGVKLTKKYVLIINTYNVLRLYAVADLKNKC